MLAHLFRYDLILGPLDADVTVTADSIVVGGASVAALAQPAAALNVVPTSAGAAKAIGLLTNGVVCAMACWAWRDCS